MAASKGNKVMFGLKNVHYAKVTEDVDGSITYGEIKAIPGAVNLSLEAQGDSNDFYADDGVYYESTTNNGYNGDLEIAKLPKDFETEILKEEEIDGMQVEKANVKPEVFALLFEFDGDANATRYCMYHCTASRPNVESKTTEDSTEVQTMTTTITARPRLKDQIVKAKCADPTSEKYKNWYTAVPEPTTTAEAA